MEETNDSLSDHLAVTVSKSGAIGLTSEMVEFAIDQTLESGVLKDLPFVGWMVLPTYHDKPINPFISHLLGI